MYVIPSQVAVSSGVAVFIRQIKTNANEFSFRIYRQYSGCREKKKQEKQKCMMDDSPVSVHVIIVSRRIQAFEPFTRDPQWP